MKGEIIALEEGKGLILSSEGNRYHFLRSEWKSEQQPVLNQKVDFVDMGGMATEIYSVKDAGNVSNNEAKVSKEVMPLAVISLVLAVVGIFVFPATIGALISGHIANKRFLDPDNQQTGKGYAKAALIIGYVWTVVVILGWVFFASMIRTL